MKCRMANCTTGEGLIISFVVFDLMWEQWKEDKKLITHSPIEQNKKVHAQVSKQ